MRQGSRGLILGVAIIAILSCTTRGEPAQAGRSAHGTLRGKVVDTAGEPVEGVKIRLYRGTYGDPFDPDTMVSVGEAAAGKDGVFSFSGVVGEYMLQLATPRDQPAPWRAEPVVVRLGMGSVAHARVEVCKGGLLDVAVAEAASDRPLPQARVSIRNLEGIPHDGAPADANGVARFHLMPGRYEIRDVLCAGYTYEGQRRVVTIEEGKTQRATMTVTPNVQGVVRDPEGLPVAGARVRLMGAGREEAVSDEQGRFDIPWDRQCQFRDATTYCLMAQHEQRNLVATLIIGRDTTALDVKLQACPVLVGRLADPNGRGIAGAWAYVTLHVPNWGDTPLREEQTQTDAEGRFQIRAVPPTGQCTLHICADAFGSRDMIVPVKTDEGLSFDVGTLTLPPANLSVAGQVRDAGGKPVAHAMIYGGGEGQPIKLNTQTDAEGRFALAGVCAGKVSLRVDAKLGGGKRLWARTLADAGATDVEITSRDLLRR